VNKVEEFKQIPEYPDYSINAQGLIKRASRTFNTKQGVRYRPEKKIASYCSKGSVQAMLYDTEGRFHCVSVSKILLQLFGEKRQVHGTIKLYAGHEDSDKQNIAIDNLKWMTKGEIRHLATMNKGKTAYLTTQEDRL
jgi:hypothetical protein